MQTGLLITFVQLLYNFGCDIITVCRSQYIVLHCVAQNDVVATVCIVLLQEIV